MRKLIAGHMIVTVAQIMAVSKMNGCVVFISNILLAILNEKGLPTVTSSV
ncbi:hypothetical protein [Ruminococcus sp. NK3A76]|nr:hypothetical protein [Ruminococcus sp. NK3A76]